MKVYNKKYGMNLTYQCVYIFFTVLILNLHYIFLEYTSNIAKK